MLNLKTLNLVGNIMKIRVDLEKSKLPNHEYVDVKAEDQRIYTLNWDKDKGEFVQEVRDGNWELVKGSE